MGFRAVVALLLASALPFAYAGTAPSTQRDVLKELRIDNLGGCQKITAECQFAVAVQGFRNGPVTP